MARRVLAAHPPSHAFPHCVDSALQQVDNYVKKTSATRIRMQNNEMQAQIDQNIFCLNERKACRLTHIQSMQLLRILANFFEARSKDPQLNDASRYSLFEVIFLGREGEAILHSTRISLLFRLASYSLQHPHLGLFCHLATWLKKMNARPAYAEELISLLVEHFVYPNPDFKLYEYLLPLSLAAPDFCLFFLSLAPRESSMGFAMASVAIEYLEGKADWLVQSLAEQPELAVPFAKQTFPALLRYATQGEEDDDEEEGSENEEGEDPNDEFVIASLHVIILAIVDRWRDMENFLEIGPLSARHAPWQQRRIELLCGISKLKSPAGVRLRRELDVALPGGLAGLIEGDQPMEIG